jgi:hypothetical protein
MSFISCQTWVNGTSLLKRGRGELSINAGTERRRALILTGVLEKEPELE